MSAEETAEELAGLIAGIQRVARRSLRRDMPAPRLRGAQIELLRIVDANPDIGVTAAARQLHLAGNSVSMLVNQLVKSGLLRRGVARGDRRVATLNVTGEARKRLRDWQDRRTALFVKTLGGLAAQDERALAAALPAMRRLAAALSEEADA